MIALGTLLLPQRQIVKRSNGHSRSALQVCPLGSEKTFENFSALQDHIDKGTLN
jgi:hypothetical protein